MLSRKPRQHWRKILQANPIWATIAVVYRRWTGRSHAPLVPNLFSMKQKIQRLHSTTHNEVRSRYVFQVNFHIWVRVWKFRLSRTRIQFSLKREFSILPGISSKSLHDFIIKIITLCDTKWDQTQTCLEIITFEVPQQRQIWTSRGTPGWAMIGVRNGKNIGNLIRMSKKLVTF